MYFLKLLLEVYISPYQVQICFYLHYNYLPHLNTYLGMCSNVGGLFAQHRHDTDKRRNLYNTPIFILKLMVQYY